VKSRGSGWVTVCEQGNHLGIYLTKLSTIQFNLAWPSRYG